MTTSIDQPPMDTTCVHFFRSLIKLDAVSVDLLRLIESGNGCPCFHSVNQYRYPWIPQIGAERQ